MPDCWAGADGFGGACCARDKFEIKKLPANAAVATVTPKNFTNTPFSFAARKTVPLLLLRSTIGEHQSSLLQDWTLTQIPFYLYITLGEHLSHVVRAPNPCAGPRATQVR